MPTRCRASPSPSTTRCNSSPLVLKDLPEYGELDLRITRGSLLRVNRAYQAFFRRLKAGKTRIPRFKPESRYQTIELSETREGMVKTTPRGWTVIRVKGLPSIRVKSQGRIPSQGLKSLHITLRCRRLTVSLTYAVEVEPLPASGSGVGIDLGVNQRLTLGNSQTIPATQPDRRREKRLQKAVSRARRGSNGRRKKVRTLARERERIRIQNRNRCHRITTALVREHGHIALEALRIPNIVRSASGTVENPGTNVAAKSGLNRSITEQTWGTLRQQLRYKAEWAGRELVDMDPRNTSRTCSRCGALALDQQEYRVFRCPDCGLEADRDVNAAINILKRSEGTPLRAHNPPGDAPRKIAGRAGQGSDRLVYSSQERRTASHAASGRTSEARRTGPEDDGAALTPSSWRPSWNVSGEGPTPPTSGSTQRGQRTTPGASAVWRKPSGHGGRSSRDWRTCWSWSSWPWSSRTTP